MLMSGRSLWRYDDNMKGEAERKHSEDSEWRRDLDDAPSEKERLPKKSENFSKNLLPQIADGAFISLPGFLTGTTKSTRSSIG